MISVYDLSPDGSRLWQRQKRETRPLEELRRMTNAFRAEGTMPPGAPMAERPPRRIRVKPLTLPLLPETSSPKPPRVPLWFVAVVVTSIAWLALIWAVRR